MRLPMLQSHHISIMESTTIEDFRNQVIRFAHCLEFDTVNALVVIDHSATATGFYYIDNTPEGYREIWTDPSLARRDPVMQHCKHSSVPIVWNQAMYVAEGEGAVWEQQAEFGFKEGIGVTLHLPDDQHFFVGVDRDGRIAEPPKALTRLVAELQLFAVHAHTAAIRLLAPDAANEPDMPRSPLTARELEALRWTMDGKLAWEVGEILNITERTAVFHLQNAAKKLGCRSKFQAVLKAIRLGLMS